MSLRNLLSLPDISIMSPEILIRVSFIFGRQHRRYQMLTKAARHEHVMKKVVLTSYKKFQRLWQFCLQISFCQFLTITPTRLTHVAFMPMMENFYAYRR